MSESAFDCRRCGHCCHGEGGIVVTAKDQARLADHLGLCVPDFLARFARPDMGKHFIRTGEDGYCVFFREGCGVHPARPDVCRAWPFFRGNLLDASSWEMIQEYCPGVNPAAGHGEFVRQGVAYLAGEGLLRSERGEAPNALLPHDEDPA